MQNYLDEALNAIIPLQRTANFPKDEAGSLALVHGLIRAAEKTGVAMDAIVEECCSSSRYCPTDADLLVVAKDLARCKAVAEGKFDSMGNAANSVKADTVDQWRKEYGKPVPFPAINAQFHAKAKAAHKRRQEMYRAIENHLGIKNQRYPDWTAMAKAARELGYEDYAKAWENAVAKVR